MIEFKLINTYVPFANLSIYLLLQTLVAFTSEDSITVYTLNITEFQLFIVALMMVNTEKLCLIF